MTNFDFSPMYRSFIGFDHLASLIDAASRNDKQPSFPPYNIELLGDDNYRITMAVAGFAEEELDIEMAHNHLTVTGKKNEKEPERKYFYRGIAERSFQRKFQLGDHVKVIGAGLENGMLNIELQREIPEQLRPRKITIGNGQLLEAGANTKV